METIVPIDSGRCQQHPNRDIRDEEIRSILQQLSRKTDKITLIFDSCHSGHITRDPSGLVFRGVEPDTADFGLSITGSRGFEAETFRYVLLAACRSDEKAGEKCCNGLWTLALVKATNMLSLKQGKVTHRDIFELAFAEVASSANVQHPLIEGPREQQDRTIFGADIVSAKPYACVTKVSEHFGEKIVCLDVGAAHGITIGTKFAVFSLSCNRPTEVDENVLVQVTKVNATTCSAIILPGADMVVEIGCRAYEKFHAFDDLSITVAIVVSSEMTQWLQTSDKNEDKDLQSLVEKLKGFIDKSPQLKWSETSDGVFCIIHLVPPFLQWKPNDPIHNRLQQHSSDVNAPHIIYFGQDNSILARPTPIGALETTLNKATETLANIGRYYRGLRIRNENLASVSNNPIHDKIKMTVEWSQDNENWNRLENYNMTVLHDGYYLRVNINNSSGKAAYIALIDFAEDGAITQVFPPEGGHEIIAPGHSLNVKFNESLTVASELGPFETLKLFATTLPADFRLLTQSGFRGGEKSSALEELLVTSATRTIPQKRNSVDYWTTDQCVFRIEKRQNS